MRAIFMASLLVIASSVSAESTPELTLPDTLHTQVVADAMRINGVPSRVLAFQSSDKLDTLVERFARQWHSMHRRRTKPWTILAHRDGDWLTTVQIRKTPNGGTRGFIAISPLFKAIEDGPKAPDIDIPRLHGTTVVNDLQASDHGKTSRTLVLRSKRSASQNLDFYRAYFKTQGYVPAGPGALAKDDDGGAMILNRGNEQLDVVASDAGQDTIVTIVRVRLP